MITIKAFMDAGNTKKPTMNTTMAKGFGIFRWFSAFVNANL